MAIELILEGPEADRPLVKDAIAAVQSPATYYTGAKVIVSYNQRLNAWTILPARVTANANVLDLKVQAELVRVVARSLRRHGLAVFVPSSQ